MCVAAETGKEDVTAKDPGNVQEENPGVTPEAVLGVTLEEDPGVTLEVVLGVTLEENPGVTPEVNLRIVPEDLKAIPDKKMTKNLIPKKKKK